MAYKVFTEHYSMDDPPSHRLSCMTTDGGLFMVLDTIPEGFSHARTTMKLVRQHLEHFYVQVENRPEFPEPYTSVLDDDAYTVLEDLFRSLAVVLQPHNISITKTTYTSLPAPSPVTPTKSTAGPGDSSGSPHDDRSSLGGSQATEIFMERLQSTLMLDETKDSDTMSDFEELNLDVDLDAWDFVSDDDFSSDSDSSIVNVTLDHHDHDDEESEIGSDGDTDVFRL